MTTLMHRSAFLLNRSQHLERAQRGLVPDGLKELVGFATGRGTHLAIVLSTNDEAGVRLEQG